MKTISRRHSLALIGQASAIVAAASVASLPVSASDNPDAELLALFDRYAEAETAWMAAGTPRDEAEYAARQEYPDYPDIIADHFPHGERFLMSAEQIDRRHAKLLLDDRIDAAGTERLRQQRHAALTAYLSKCRAIDLAHGVDELKAQEDLADEIMMGIFDQIIETPALTFAGLAAKLRLANVYEEFTSGAAGLAQYLLTSALDDAEAGAEAQAVRS
jgi:hypothetical protein